MRFVAGALERIVAIRVADVMGEEPEMQRYLSTTDRGLRAGFLGLALVSALVISGCGPIGGDDDDSEPTSTVETISQPTTNVEAPSDASPTAKTPPAFLSDSTPGPFVAAPDIPGEVSATPSSANQTVPGGPGTPDSFNATPSSVSGVDSEGTPPAFTGSDGTSGATPGAENLEAETEEVVATPPGNGEFFVEEVATPDPNSILVLTPVEVSGCDPETAPELDAAQPAFITAVNVNFRVGPGADCDQIGADPISAGVPVTILSGPVVRDDDDTFTWVQVEIEGETGWVVIEAIEPAP